MQRTPHNRKIPVEGTIELKYAETELPNLRVLSQGHQIAALLDYFEAGGRRRFALCYSRGEVFLWDTRAYFNAIRSTESKLLYTSRIPLEHPDFCSWLIGNLKPYD